MLPFSSTTGLLFVVGFLVTLCDSLIDSCISQRDKVKKRACIKILPRLYPISYEKPGKEYSKFKPMRYCFKMRFFMDFVRKLINTLRSKDGT